MNEKLKNVPVSPVMKRPNARMMNFFAKLDMRVVTVFGSGENAKSKKATSS